MEGNAGITFQAKLSSLHGNIDCNITGAVIEKIYIIYCTNTLRNC